MDDIRQLKIVINSSHKEWLLKFIELGGISSLSSLLKDNVGNGIDSLDNNILNYSTSLSDAFANYEQRVWDGKSNRRRDAMDAIVLCLNFSDLELAEKDRVGL